MEKVMDDAFMVMSAYSGNSIFQRKEKEIF